MFFEQSDDHGQRRTNNRGEKFGLLDMEGSGLRMFRVEGNMMMRGTLEVDARP